MSESESETGENDSSEVVRKTVAIGTGDGPGKVLFASGNQFDGEYRKGLKHGRGIFSFTSGARYDGDYVKGLKHGFGKFTYPDGSFYCGDWKQNQRHGFGKYVYENGDLYEGSWKEDKKHGVGRFKYQQALVCLNATWINGSPKGPIEICYENFRYHGYWKDQSPVGDGVFSFGMKYMLPGHVERVFNPSTATVQSASKESFKVFKMESNIKGNLNRESDKLTNENDVQDEADKVTGDCCPRFVAHEIKTFNYSKLPQQPLCLPQDDSVTTLCTKSSRSSSSELKASPQEGDENSSSSCVEVNDDNSCVKLDEDQIDCEEETLLE